MAQKKKVKSVTKKAEPKPAPVERQQAPAVPAASKGKVLVANYHTGGITFPRRSPDNKLLLKPLRLHPGTTTEVDAEEWAKHKKIKTVQLYMDKGLIAEVKRNDADVPMKESTSSDLEIPEHLQTDEEALQGNMLEANVRKAKPGTVEIK